MVHLNWKDHKISYMAKDKIELFIQLEENTIMQREIAMIFRLRNILHGLLVNMPESTWKNDKKAIYWFKVQHQTHIHT